MSSAELLRWAEIDLAAVGHNVGQLKARFPFLELDGFETKPLLKSGKTADGDTLQYLKTDKPEIVAVTGTIQPGGRTPLHQHPIPVFVYVMEGELEVQTEGKEPRGYKTGDSFIESMNRSHQAFNKGTSPAKILVVFVGEADKPTTIVPK